MTTRENQKRLISRIRRSLVASSVVGSLGLAGYLGISTQSASATEEQNTTDNSSDTSTDTSDTTTFADQNGGSTDVTSGSGSAHAVTSGS